MNLLKPIAERVLGPEIRSLVESISSVKMENERLRESFLELEQSLQTIGWQRYAADWRKEFSEQGRRDMLQICRMMFVKNPLINRGVLIKSTYVWGQGCRVSSEDKTVQATLDAFFEDPKNECEFSGHQARTMKEQELEVTGNLYFVLFASMVDAQTTVRTIPCEEITRIICDPEDAKSPQLYLREWSQEVLDLNTGATTFRPTKTYYPDWCWEPEARPQTIGGVPVNWDSPVYHVKIGGLPDMKFGIPEIYAAIDWAMAYKSFLEDWASIVRAYARFAWEYNTNGGPRAVTAAQAALSTTIGDVANSNRLWDRNPPSLSASTIVTAGDNSMKPIKTSGATTSAEDGRYLLLMVACAFGFPETFFGNSDVGNHATAQTLDRPTELNIMDRQKLWSSIYVNLGRWVVAKSQRAPRGMMFAVDNAKAKSVHCTFPPILEHDVTETINAFVAAATLNGSAPGPAFDLEAYARGMLEALGVPNIDDVIIRLKAAEEQAKADAKKMLDATQQQPVVKAMEAFKAELLRFAEKYPAAA